MAAINLNPSLTVQSGLAGAEVRPAVNIQPSDPDIFNKGMGAFETSMNLVTKTAEANQKRIEAYQKARQLKNDEKFNVLPTMDQAETLAYQKDFGGVPRTATGDIDINEIRTKMREIGAMRHANAKTAAALSGMTARIVPMMNPLTGFLEDRYQLIDQASGKATNLDFLGTFNEVAKLQAQGGNGTGAKPGDGQALDEQITRANQFSQKLTDVKSLINDPNMSVVGSAAGSAPGRWYAGLSSFLNQLTGGTVGSTATANAQGEVNRFISGQTMELTSLLKGPLSEKELAFLRKAVPELTTNREPWNAWLDELSEFYQTRTAALAARKAAGQAEPNYLSDDAYNFSQKLRQRAGETPAASGLGKAPITPAQ
jgi:hypothetical protein